MISIAQRLLQKRKRLVNKHRVRVIAAAALLIVALATLSACSTGRQVTDTTDNLLHSQKDADERIKKELKSGDHSFDDPLVIENPYLIAPLTAIITFNTGDEAPIEM